MTSADTDAKLGVRDVKSPALAWAPGQQVSHSNLGAGIIVSTLPSGLIRVFFANTGERQVPAASLVRRQSRSEDILTNVSRDPQRLSYVKLCLEAHALPLMDGATALTSAKIDLLPHQVVLTHRVATAGPRRFLIADEVGLGKTIEVALLLRELASRGELERALIVVPAGLVHNWSRELNDVFHLDFEVFGSEGDVTDRKTNAFTKHDRLIASIDTLKRPARVKRLREAPGWDLIVFDEAHHLTAHRNGNRVRRTDNYKLAEVLKDHTRDLLLLSATPHQGAHFPFWMLIQLLNSSLFKSSDDMVANRHRLNAVVFRRTKADACTSDGSPLFARRVVHTEASFMSDEERAFYWELREYLQDGFALAKRRGQQGNALGFIMAIFQKIAASSFAAVRRTLRRRMLALTIHEGILRDQELDIDARQRLSAEARAIIREEFNLDEGPVGRGEADRILAELRLKLLRKLNEEEELASAASEGSSESGSIAAEDLAAFSVTAALPEERQRIRTLLEKFPTMTETKVDSLLRALSVLWAASPNERIVVFATYLGTVELLQQAITKQFPERGVVVLKGGDHGAKVAAERRFRSADGPKVLVCTAAGREGINLQFARVLFNFDLPWNPMDVEQRIGRIHRYGQNSTAQIYNLVLADTIEGRIYLLLQTKLREIARTLGKVDPQGNVAEDLQAQILGQLSEKLSYDRLYQAALEDPELKRTELELEAALHNASEARQVLSELFQDLDRFSIEEYLPLSDSKAATERLVRFFGKATETSGDSLQPVSETILELRDKHGNLVGRFTTDRDKALQSEDLEFLALDLPIVEAQINRWREIEPSELGFVGKGNRSTPYVVTNWAVEIRNAKGTQQSMVITLAFDLDGRRVPDGESMDTVQVMEGAVSPFDAESRMTFFHEIVEPALQRELEHRGVVDVATASVNSSLIGWIEAL